MLTRTWKRVEHEMKEKWEWEKRNTRGGEMRKVSTKLSQQSFLLNLAWLLEW